MPDYRFNSRLLQLIARGLSGLAAVIVLAVAGPGGQIRTATADVDSTRPHCETCRRFFDTSPSRMEVLFSVGKRIMVKQLCSTFCYLEMMEDFTDLEPDRTRVINYATLDTEMALWLNLDNAFFIMTNDGDPELCHDPYAFAYSTQKQAEAAAGEDAVLILDWPELRELLLPLTDEYEPKKPGKRYKSNRRRPS